MNEKEIKEKVLEELRCEGYNIGKEWSGVVDKIIFRTIQEHKKRVEENIDKRFPKKMFPDLNKELKEMIIK